MPLRAKHPRIQTRNLDIGKRQPEILQRLGRPEALLHIDPPTVSRVVYIRKLCIPKRRFTMLFHGGKRFPRPIAIPVLAGNTPRVEQRFDILRPAFVLRVCTPEAGCRYFFSLALSIWVVQRVVVAEFRRPRPRLRANFGGCGCVRVTAAFEKGEGEGAEGGLVVELGGEEDSAGCEAGEVAHLVLVLLVILPADEQVLHEVFGRGCGAGAEVFSKRECGIYETFFVYVVMRIRGWGE